jgi:hypothetical protein
MDKIVVFVRSISSTKLIIASVVLTVIAKLLEKYSADLALGIQLITFILFISALIKFTKSK